MIKWQVIAGALAVLLIGLVAMSMADRNDGRVLRYEKGTYLGKPDTVLGDETVGQIRHRGRNEASAW